MEASNDTRCAMKNGSEVKELNDGKVERLSPKPEFAPEADIYETEEAIQLAMNMPGVNEKEIDIDLDGDTLSVSAPQTEDAPQGMSEAYSGYRTGIYKRSFSILAEIDRAKVKAKVANGVLRLTLPKAEKSKPRKIEISAE